MYFFIIGNNPRCCSLTNYPTSSLLTPSGTCHIRVQLIVQDTPCVGHVGIQLRVQVFPLGRSRPAETRRPTATIPASSAVIVTVATPIAALSTAPSSKPALTVTPTTLVVVGKVSPTATSLPSITSKTPKYDK